MKGTRIILFGPMPPPYGGVSVFMSRLAEAALSRGVEIWGYGSERRAKAPNIYLFNHRRLDHIRRLLRVGRRARIVDSTHFHLEYPHPLLVPLWLFMKALLGFRWVKVVHDGSLPARYEDFGPRQRRRFRAVLSHIDELVAVNLELEKWLQDVAEYKGDVTHVPTLLPPVAESARSAKAIALPTAFLDHEFRVCSLGVFIPDYGFDEVAEAVERLRSTSGVDIGLLLIDAGFAYEASYRDRVLKGRDWIEVARALPHSRLPTVLAMNDVFVRPFKHESFGLSRVEALWAGIPVVATDIGETRGMQTYKSGDVDALCRQIDSVLSGEADFDIELAAEMFRAEAEQNLAAYLRIVTGDNAD